MFSNSPGDVQSHQGDRVTHSELAPLINMSRVDLIESVYQMGLLLDRRSILPTVDASTILKAVSAVSGYPISPSNLEAITRVIANIEATEGKPLQDIEENRLASYRRELTDAVMKASKKYADDGDFSSEDRAAIRKRARAKLQQWEELVSTKHVVTETAVR